MRVAAVVNGSAHAHSVLDSLAWGDFLITNFYPAAAPLKLEKQTKRKEGARKPFFLSLMPCQTSSVAALVVTILTPLLSIVMPHFFFNCPRSLTFMMVQSYDWGLKIE